MKGPVLVVDDEPDSRMMLATLLECAGFAVTTACDGRDALAQSHRQRPCVIVLDLMMPRMTGEEFREVQRNDPEICDIPIVVVSAKHDASETARRMNAAAFSPKPLDADLLIDAVTHCCADAP